MPDTCGASRVPPQYAEQRGIYIKFYTQKGDTEMKHYRPGKGWRNMPGPHGDRSPVYEHSSGLRVHVGGVWRHPAGGTHSMEHYVLHRMTQINGGNRRRGAMAVGRQIIEALQLCH